MPTISMKIDKWEDIVFRMMSPDDWFAISDRLRATGVPAPDTENHYAQAFAEVFRVPFSNSPSTSNDVGGEYLLRTFTAHFVNEDEMVLFRLKYL